MLESKDLGDKSFPRERKYRRYDLEYPVSIHFETDGKSKEITAKSKNLSVGGLLLDVPTEIPLHTLISFVMTVKGGALRRPVQLKGKGEVVRLQPEAAEKSFGIAVQCSSPMVQLEREIPRASL